jgi:RNA polymerase sigma-70 factor (ECF subfamily)
MSTPVLHPDQASEIPDAHLVMRVLNGDMDAYSGLVRRHQDAIYRHARGLGLDHDTSVDVVQDALVRAYDRLEDCRDGANYRAWLFRICRNLCYDELRNVRRRLTIPMSEMKGADSIEDPRGSPNELELTLREALGRVPDVMREAFLLKHDAGYTYEEIAELTDASPSAVKMRVHRAREALREFLELQGIRPDGILSIACDNSGSAKRLTSEDGTERQASHDRAMGAPAKTIRRMS